MDFPAGGSETPGLWLGGGADFCPLHARPDFTGHGAPEPAVPLSVLVLRPTFYGQYARLGAKFVDPYVALLYLVPADFAFLACT